MLRAPRFLSSLGFSTLLHLAVTVMFVVGFPWFAKPPHDIIPTLTAEIVDDVPITNLDEGLPGQTKDNSADDEVNHDDSKATPAAASASAPPPPPPPPPSPPQKQADAKPEPMDAPLPKDNTPDAVALNLEEQEQDVPPPKPKADETKAQSQSAPAPLPKAKPKETKRAEAPTPAKKPDDETANYLKNDQNTAKTDAELGIQLQNLLDEAQRPTQPEDDEKKVEKKDDPDDSKNQQNLADLLDDTVRDNAGQAINTQKRDDGRLGADVITRLKSHIQPCWNPPSAIEGASSLIVDIIVELNEDGEVIKVRIKDILRYNADDAFRLAANAAERAFQQCSPLIPPLSPEDYEKWKTLNFRFDPRGFLT
jgi:hypothetical protein